MRKLLRWLKPGLRIKRWIALIFVGFLFALLATTAFYVIFTIEERENSLISGNLIAAAVIGYALSAYCLITGLYRLLKSMWELVEHRGRQTNLVDAALKRATLTQGARVVAIGGGTGLSVVLTGLRDLAGHTTAIVSMADDGGSSGKLRQEMGLQPPGDLRKCLIALADEEPLMSELLDYRFPDHELGGHSFGNLFLTVLSRIRGDFGAGIREANRILSVRGQVLPSTLTQVYLVAHHEDGSKTTGQARIAKTEKRIKRLELKPDPEPVAGDILSSIENAELIVLGPGSLYTSVLPNLLIDGMAAALAKSKARKVFVCNIMTYEGETRGYDLADCLKAIDDHTKPYHVYDYVLVHDGSFEITGKDIVAPQGNEDTWMVNGKAARVVHYDLQNYLQQRFRVVARDVVNPAYPIRHDTGKLARALLEILNLP